MAELLARLAGKVGANTTNLIAWTDADVDITCVLSDGQSQTIGSVAATDYGVVEFIFSGLNSAATYTAVVTSQGLTKTLYPRTTANEGDTFSLCAAPCQQNGNRFNHAPLIGAYNPIFFFGQGDWPYINLDWAIYGLTGWNNLGTSMTDAQRHEYHLSVMRDPYYQALMSICHWIHSMDDHEVPGGNHNNSLSNTNNGVNASFLYSDSQVALAEGRAATEIFNQSRQFSAGTAEPTYPAHYHAFDCGDARIIVLDCLTYKTPVTTNAYPTSTCLGIVQNPWLINDLKTTGKTWKFIISDKQFISDNPSGDGMDGYNHADGEANLILDYIDAAVNGGNPDNWVSPGGCVILTGDRHYNAYHFDRCLQITASLGGTHGNGDMLASTLQHLWGYEASSNYNPATQDGAFLEAAGGFAAVTVHGSDKLTINVDTLRGRWGQCELLPGQNIPTYPDQKISVG